MPSEMEKMLAGELYDPLDPQLVAGRRRARELLQAYNASREDPPAERQAVLRQLIGRLGADVWIEPPFYCDYGSNITLGERVYFNFNCVILDPGLVTIGDRVLCGPGVQIYTATHPLDSRERAAGLESARPIKVGADVWIGGAAVLCPGVKIGPRSVIGAGSVVTRDVPADVLAAGNPCRVIRALP